MEKQMYRGIGDVYILWHGEWADPELEYNGMVVNYHYVEDAMYSNFRYECEASRTDHHMISFTRYCMDRADIVKQLIEDIWDQSNN